VSSVLQVAKLNDGAGVLFQDFGKGMCRSGKGVGRQWSPKYFVESNRWRKEKSMLLVEKTVVYEKDVGMLLL